MIETAEQKLEQAVKLLESVPVEDIASMSEAEKKELKQLLQEINTNIAAIQDKLVKKQTDFL